MTLIAAVGLVAVAQGCTAVERAPTATSEVRVVSVVNAQWIDYKALTWVVTGVETPGSTSDTGFLGAGSEVALVPGATKGSHERRVVAGKKYAEATLIEASPGSLSPPNHGVRFWIDEADLR